MAFNPYSELINKMQKEITLLRQMVIGEEPDIFEKQEQIISELQEALAKKDLELAAARRAARKKNETIDELRNELDESRTIILVRQAEDYRRENIELKLRLEEAPKVVYRNAPPVEVLKESGINTIYIEKPKRGKSKEQQTFDRKYKKARLKILERDNYKCVNCGKDEDLHVHHKIHKSDGGTNDPENLITLCKWCHAERHKGEPVYNLMHKALL